MFNINKYHDLHKGESCYIFGNGPSIKWFDLSVFSDYVGISTGSIPFHNDFKKLNVKYHAIVEPWYYCPKWMQRYQLLRDARLISKKHKDLMSQNKGIDFFINVTSFPWVTGLNINYVHRMLINKHSK